MTEQPQAVSRPAPPISVHTDPISEWLWKNPLAQLVMLFFPVSVVPFLRHSQGHRLLKMWVLVIDALFLLLWGGIGAMGGGSSFLGQRAGISPLLLLFVAAMLGLGWLHGRRGRYLELRGDLISTSRGTPWLAKIPALTRLPFVNEDFIKLKLEPLVCIAAGVLAWPFSGALAAWLCVSGIVLAGWEQLLLDQEENRFWDMVDGVTASKWAGVAQQMMRQTGKRPEPSATGGCRVVFDPKMQALWEQATRGQGAQPAYVAPDVASAPIGNGAVPLGAEAA